MEDLYGSLELSIENDHNLLNPILFALLFLLINFANGTLLNICLLYNLLELFKYMD